MNQESDKTNQGRSMLKNCLKTLFLFIFPAMGFAQIGSLSYEDFVHLSEKDQDRFVIKTMELIVRLENAHKNDPRTMHFTDEEEKKFTLFLKQLKGTLFIDEAHASTPYKDADKEWDKAAKDFTALITQDSDKKKCVYAGWISKAIGEGSNVTCAHPGYIMGDKSKKDQTPEGRAYIAPSSGSPCDQGGIKKIQCSPVIFGYKSIKDKTPFCVSAQDMARNSSFDCMQAALDLDEKNKGDSKEDRLNYIKSRLTDPKNKDVFKQVHEFNYKMCVCDSKPIPANFSDDYLKEIQLHQTCYGMMKMIGETSKKCDRQSLPSGMDLTIFEQLDDYINPLKNMYPTPNKVPANVYGAWYSKYIKKLRSNKTSEYVRLCGGKVTPQPKPTDPNYTCTGTCDINKPASGTMACNLKIKKDKDKEEAETIEFNMAKYTDDNLLTQKVPLTIKRKGYSKDIPCIVTASEPPKPDDPPKDKWPKYSCEALCTQTAVPDLAGKNCVITTFEITGPPATTRKTMKSETKFLKPDEKLELKDPRGEPLTCLEQSTKPENSKTPSTCKAQNCVTENEVKEGSKRCDLEITKNVNGEAKTEKITGAILIKNKYTYGDETLTCNEENPKPNEEQKKPTLPTLKVSASEKDPKSYDVKAEKTDDQDWAFSWVVKGGKEIDVSSVTKDWENKTGTPPAGMAVDDQSITAPGSKSSFVQQRAKVDFDLCGQLKKDGEATIESCATIKKYIEEKKPLAATPNGQQGNIPSVPPQPMIRNSSDASAVGIR
jgi:hypothetical protein